MSARTVAFLLALITLFIVALSTGATLYYLAVGMLGMMLLLSYVSALLTMYTARLEFRVPSASVLRGESVQLIMRVRHLCPFPVAAIVLTLSMPENGGVLTHVRAPSFPFTSSVLRVNLPCPHRGVYAVGVDRMYVTDVFGLFTLSRAVRKDPIVLTVTPRLHAQLPLDVSSGESGPEQFAMATEDMASPADVRAYREGDVLKKIHWKLTMRKRELIVRQYEESMRPDTLILLDSAHVDQPRIMALKTQDALCELAASIARVQLNMGYPVRMPLFSSTQMEPSGKSPADFPRFLDALTQLRFDCEHPFTRVVSLEMRRMQRTGGALLITPRISTDVCDLALQMRRTGMQVRVYWVSESRRSDAMSMLTRMTLLGVPSRRISPLAYWEEKHG